METRRIGSSSVPPAVPPEPYQSALAAQGAKGCRHSEVSHSFFILGCRLVTQDSSNEITTVCFSHCGSVEMGSELSCDVLT